MEEARAYKALMTDFGRTQSDVAEAIGKSRPYVANLLKFLNLPEQVQSWISSGQVSVGHAKALANVPDPQGLAARVIEEGLSVRETETLAKALRDGKTPDPIKAKAYKDPNTIQLETQIMDSLGLAVDLRDKGGAGEVRIKYKTQAQLEALVKRLKSN